jgi:hypothetical protein
MKAQHSRVALLLALVICFSSAAHASTAIYIPLGEPSNATDLGGFVGGSLFWRAPGSGSVTFNSLGFIDLNTDFPTLLGPDGISGTYQVALWRVDTYTQSPPGFGPIVPTSWTLLASTTITPASPLGDSPSDTFRYNSIPPTTINPDEYIIIGAMLPTGPLPDKWLNGNAPVNFAGFVGPGIGYNLSGGTFSVAGAARYIANASTQIIVPEPASLSLLVMASLAMLRRRRV